MKDVIIIGAGPAGISASLYALRANLKVAIFYLNNSSLNKAHLIENYYGIVSISGDELYKTGLKQAKRLGAELIKDEVLSITSDADTGYKVEAKNHCLTAKTIILATGMTRTSVAIKGLKELEGKGVSYCATCDGFFYRQKRIAVIGTGSYALHEANYLRNISDNITVFTNGKPIEDIGLKDFLFIPDAIEKIEGKDKVEAIVANGITYPVDGIFIAIGKADSLALARELGVLIENNKILTDENMQTNLAGIYAAGDCTKGLLQVSKAVYEGAEAATSIVSYLQKMNLCQVEKNKRSV